MKYTRHRPAITHARRATATLTAVFASVSLLLASFASARPVHAQLPRRDAEPVSAATREGRLQIFDDVWETVRDRYYDPQLRGLDWDGARAEFRDAAASASNQTELYIVLRRMLSRLRDPHTRVYAPDERFDWREPKFLSVGVRVREVEGELLVSEVERGSEAERAGVRAGDAVVSVDGVQAATIFARRLQEQSGVANDGAASASKKKPSSSVAVATANARAVAAARLFEGERDSTAFVIFKSVDDSREKTVSLRRTLTARPASLRLSRVAGRRYGVAQFGAFTPDIAAAFARAMNNELRGARGLVIDLRDNGGGDAEALADIASVFLPAGTKLGSFTDRDGRVQLEPQTRAAMLSAADALVNFRGPVVLLASPRTASAAEVLISALAGAGRARVLGETTCGCVLGIRRRHTLPDGGLLDVSEMDFRTPVGARLEGAGVRPDEHIAPTRRDLRAGRDRAMERAVEILKDKN